MIPHLPVSARASGRRPLRRRRLLALGAAVVPGLLAACGAPDRPPYLPTALPEAVTERLAPDTTRTVRVADGVWYRYLWSAGGPWAIHLLEADLRRCDLAIDVVRAGGPEGPGGHAPVTELAETTGRGPVVAAVNGDFFTPEGTPLGPELADGRLRTFRARPAFSWRPGGEPWIGTAGSRGDSALFVGWSLPVGDSVAGEVVGGWPELLDRGDRVGDLLVEENPGFAASRHPRTAVAWDPGRRRLWLVVVDGRQGAYSVGMTLPELAGLFEALGASEALNLDGGGSSVMVIRGNPVSRPSDETGERPVVNALLLRQDPSYCAGA